MPNKKWTDEQLNAINYRGGNLLVAAGAGSGKTSVLVERVLRLIGTGGEAGYGGVESGDSEAGGERFVLDAAMGIDRLLIVTFTTAAAGEMKERIAEALSDKLDAIEMQSIDNEAAEQAAYLRQQLILLDNASISTLHSFCYSVIKDNVNLIDGLDSGFRLMDDAEASLLRADALDDVLEERYADETNAAFANLVESYGMGRDDRKVAEVVLRTYNFTQSAPWPSEWLERMTERFCVDTKEGFGASVWAGCVVELLAGELDSVTAILRRYGATVLECIKNEAKRDEAAHAIDGIFELYNMCSGAVGGGDDSGSSGIDGSSGSNSNDGGGFGGGIGDIGGGNGTIIDWERLRSAAMALGDMACLCPRAARGEDAARKTGREAVKTAVRKLKNEYFDKYLLLEFSDIADEFRRSHALLRELSSVVDAFTRRYSELKRSRAVADYNDLEHFAINILMKRDAATGNYVPSEAANAYRNRFAEVLVDEYQDINMVQEYIIKAVSGGRIFMVGDVKQSIYRFRQAMPEIFMDKYRSYVNVGAGAGTGAGVGVGAVADAPVAPSVAPPGVKALLYANFRSDRHILDFVNTIFGSIMSEKAGELDYTEEEWLRPGTVDQAHGFIPELHIISKKPPVSASINMRGAVNFASESDGLDSSHTGDDMADGAAESGDIGSAVLDDFGSAEPWNVDNAEPEDVESVELEDIGNAELEARFVAQQIYELMREARLPDAGGGERAVTYGDIAVLMRATKVSAPAFRDELIRLGVPAYTDSGSAYFEKYEISVMLSLLRIIDNPLQDIPLFTVMLSPIFSFTAEEATMIRRAATPPGADAKAVPGESDTETSGAANAETPGVANVETPGAADTETPGAADDARSGGAHKPLYDCLAEIASLRSSDAHIMFDGIDGATVEKAQAAITALAQWRRLSINKPVSALIWGLMHDTGFYLQACAMPGGEQRRANLLKLFEYARTYEQISYKGIFSFLRFVDRMIEQGDDLAEASLFGQNTDSVRIMSIHKSKGLEFPVVFLAGCGKSFNMRDTMNQLLLHRDAGFGPNYVDLERRVVDDTIAKKVIATMIRNEALSEEMRILYVALTRAKNRLYLVGTLANADNYRRKIDDLFAPYGDQPSAISKFPPAFALKADKFMFWILSSLKSRPEFPIYMYAASDFTDAEAYSNGASDTPQDAPQTGEPLPDVSPAGAPADAPPFDGLLPDRFYDELDAQLSWEYPYSWLFDIPKKVTVTDIVQARSDARRHMDRIEDNNDGIETEIGLLSPEATEISGDATTGQRGDALAIPKFMIGTRDFTRAQIGTFTHLVLEKADFSRGAEPDTLEALIEGLVENGTLLPEQAAAVDRWAILNFFNSTPGKLAAGAEKLNRETMFTVKLTLDEYWGLTRHAGTGLPMLHETLMSPKLHEPPETPELHELPDSLEPSEPPTDMPFVLMQGSIDCWFETLDGIVLIDYKTGFTAQKDISNEHDSKYRQQIELYALVLKKITGQDVARKFICMLSANSYIEV